jgi:hypothetical protein
MKIRIKTFGLFIAAACGLLLNADLGRAGVDVPWSTTFNCNDWTSPEQALSCDGLTSGGGWRCNQGGEFHEQIIPDANNPAGGGGRGQRHYVGDGTNVNSGGTLVSFNQAQPELWVRWYMKYSPGFRWKSIDYQKILYFHTDAPGTDVLPEWHGPDGFRVYAQNGGGDYSCENCGWGTLNKGDAADGLWHWYELHLRMDTNGQNGIVEAWIDGVQILNRTDADLGTRAGWYSILIGSNQRSPLNGGCAYIDYDDIAVGNAGYIGPVS